MAYKLSAKRVQYQLRVTSPFDYWQACSHCGRGESHYLPVGTLIDVEREYYAGERLFSTDGKIANWRELELHEPEVALDEDERQMTEPWSEPRDESEAGDV